MGYITRKTPYGWRLVHRTDHGNKQKEERSIPKDSSEFSSLGLRESMTREEAIAALKLHRNEREATRLLNRKAKIHAKIAAQKVIECAWLPPELVEDFEKDVITSFQVRRAAWESAKKIIVKVPIPPRDWLWKSGILVNLMIDQALSPDYCRRIWHAIRTWHGFYTYRTEGSTPAKMPEISPEVYVRIKRAYQERTGGKYDVVPLTEEMLATAKKKLPELQYNWLRVALYFGLRPQEMKSVKPENSPSVWFIKDYDERWALHIYQKKLESKDVAEIHRWKAIPAIEPEQKALREIIENQKWEEPIVKTLKSIFKQPVKLRSPRRNFRPWMLSRHPEYKSLCSIWLGHIQSDTLMADMHYGGEHHVSWPPTEQQRMKKTG